MVPNELRFALRNVLRAPGFSATVVMTLAIGVGATSTVFAVLQRVLHPFGPKTEDLAFLWLEDRETRATRVPTGAVIAAMRDHLSAATVAAFGGSQCTIGGTSPQRVQSRIVSRNFGRGCGRPTRGRT